MASNTIFIMNNFLFISLLIFYLLASSFADDSTFFIIKLPKLPKNIIAETVQKKDSNGIKWHVQTDDGESDLESKSKSNSKSCDKDHHHHHDKFEHNLTYLEEGRNMLSHGNDKGDKIVGGVEVDISLYPYHVAYGDNCGGGILHRDWVITAAHCGQNTYIRAGSKYLEEGIKIPIRKWHLHPEWNLENKDHPFDYDFQLLELGEPLKFSENIQSIKVGRIEDMIVGRLITVTGWGHTSENGSESNTLRAVRLPITSKKSCQLVPFPYYRGYLTSRMFCAGFVEGIMDACQGDSGGPAVADDRLLGLVSFGYGCATPGAFGVYSKVVKARKWIQDTTNLYLD